MNSLSVGDGVRLFRSIAQKMQDNKLLYCQLDGDIGDGDHGVAMERGFAAVGIALESLDASKANWTDLFNTAANAYLGEVGGSTGPLYASAFLKAAIWAEKRAFLLMDDAPNMIVAFASGIASRGKAAIGDKTMFDVWGPVAGAIEGGMDIEDIAAFASKSAKQTAELEAKKGRAARLGARSKGVIDPGAASAAAIISAIVAELIRKRNASS